MQDKEYLRYYPHMKKSRTMNNTAAVHESGSVFIYINKEKG